MKAYSIFIIFMSLTLNAVAQNLNSRITVDTSHLNHTVLPDSLMRLDFNGDATSLIRFESDLDSLSFSGNIMGNINHTGLVYDVYITSGSKSIKIEHPKYLSYEIEFQNPIHGNELIDGYKITGITETVQHILLDKDKKDTDYRVEIKAPLSVTVFVDNEEIDDQRIVYLRPGIHFFSAEYNNSTLVKPIEKRINANNDNIINFGIDGKIPIHYTRKNAHASITSLKESLPPMQRSNTDGTEFYGLNGEYLVKVYCDGYEPKRKKFKISDGKTADVWSPKWHDIYNNNTFISYQFSTLLPIGFNLSYCRKWGLYFSAAFKPKDDEHMEKRQCYMIGPMMRLQRHWYLQAGLGMYGDISEWEDGSASINCAIGASIIYRVRNFNLGVGYQHYFAEDDEYLDSQLKHLNFSIGLCL